MKRLLLQWCTTALVFEFCLPVLLYGGIKIGKYHQMFLDDYIVESIDNIFRQINPAQKYDGNPIIRPDEPWEVSNTILFGSVIHNPQTKSFHMWYYSDGNVGYAVSRDGMKWNKPELDIIHHNGRKTNLLIQRGAFGHFYELFDVLKDEKDPDPNRRYKMSFVSIQRNVPEHLSSPYHNDRRGLGVAFSRDGIHWNLADNFASLGICDISHMMVDTFNSDKFVIYGRTKHISKAIQENWAMHDWFRYYWGRSVVRMQSTDFLTWREPELVMTADLLDPPGTEIYSMAVYPYEGIYIGFVQTYLNNPDAGTLEIQLAVSRDGKNFTRLREKPFIPLGDIGQWDRFNNSISSIPVIVNDKIRFYYGGRTYRHSGSTAQDSGPRQGYIGLATILRDRFVSIQSGFDGGILVTKPLEIAGTSLYLNCNAAFGSIDISLLNQQGEAVPGYHAHIAGIDSIRVPVIFQNSLSALRPHEDTSIKLRFILKNAELYSFYVE